MAELIDQAQRVLLAAVGEVEIDLGGVDMGVTQQGLNREPSGGGSRETDCDEGAALKRSGRVSEPEAANESTGWHRFR